MRQLEEFAKYTLILLSAMAVAWGICVTGLWTLGVL